MNENSTPSVEKFLVVGIITANEFQKARFIVEKISKSFPKSYDPPEIRPMLDVEWDEYIIKTRRHIKPLWQLQKNVAVFVNESFLGDDVTLVRYLARKFQFHIHLDWPEVGKCHLVEYLRDIMGQFRQLVYMTVAINHRVIGTMLFMLYNDLVPLTCENFLNRCRDENGGYTGTPINRIMKNSWIQCGGCDLPEIELPCENYSIPHNRRGVLSMCNEGRHKKNSTQFFITLAPTPWMDYRYVAFGQLLQGHDILNEIESMPTYFESPKRSITIVKCGELNFFDEEDPRSKELQGHCFDILMALAKESKFPRRTSYFSKRKLQAGAYGLLTDLQSYYWPFMTPLHYLTAKYDSEDGVFVYEKLQSVSNFRKSFVQDYQCLPQDPSTSDVTI